MIKIIVEKTNTGYSAFAEDYDAYTVGVNMEELKKNILEALSLHLDRIVKENDLLIQALPS